MLNKPDAGPISNSSDSSNSRTLGLSLFYFIPPLNQRMRSGIYRVWGTHGTQCGTHSESWWDLYCGTHSEFLSVSLVSPETCPGRIIENTWEKYRNALLLYKQERCRHTCRNECRASRHVKLRWADRHRAKIKPIIVLTEEFWQIEIANMFWKDFCTWWYP